MLSLAFDGITSLSVKPIRMIAVSKVAIAFVSFIGILHALISNLAGAAVPGWTSMVCIFCFIGGIQLSALGVIGEYVGKIYLETKQRPRHIISERTSSMSCV